MTMPPTTQPDDRVSAAQAARAAVASGRPVVVAIEGAAAVAAADPASPVIQALAARAEWKPGMFRLCVDADQVAGVLDPPTQVHARMIRRLSPGGAIFVRNLTHRAAGHGARAAMASDLSSAAALVAAAHAAGQTLAVVEITDSRGEMVRDLDQAARVVAEIGPAGAAPRPPLVFGGERAAEVIGRTPATVIELLDAGGFRVLRPGIYEERFIRKQLGLNILFVCTGNTCRSPMAEAIASALTARTGGGGGGGVELRIGSAGTAASAGAPMTPEAVVAVRELGLGGSGAAGGGHRSRPLSRKLIAEADVILTMSRSHLAAVLDLDPDAESKARTLDPAGGDVPDPIGSSQAVYNQTAQRIMEMVLRRLKEFGA